MKLDHSVREYQEGKEEKDCNRRLNRDPASGTIHSGILPAEFRTDEKVIWEQNERRKSEFDVLQSQINPHFLYNTLDSITWMIESGKMRKLPL